MRGQTTTITFGPLQTPAVEQRFSPQLPRLKPVVASGQRKSVIIDLVNNKLFRGVRNLCIFLGHSI